MNKDFVKELNRGAGRCVLTSVWRLLIMPDIVERSMPAGGVAVASRRSDVL